VVVYSEVVADPPESNVLEATRLARERAVSGVVGFGGGSSLDVAKLAAYLAHEYCTEGLADIFGVNMCRRSQRLPLVQVPTTAGTGSEVTPVSVITTGEAQKKAVVSAILLPDCAVLDGTLTVSMPRGLTAATGIDAMVHAIEAITSRVRKNPLSRALALDALRLLRANIEGVCGPKANDVSARSAMLLGSTYAGMAFANAPVGAVHALAYPIGATFHVAHGVSNALMLSHVLRFNAEDPGAAREYALLQRLLFPDNPVSGEGDLAAALAFADSMHALAASIGLPMRLRDVGISEQDVPKLAADAMQQGRLLLNNPRNVSLGDAAKLYADAL
jgi:alcohol dehydrogenase